MAASKVIVAHKLQNQIFVVAEDGHPTAIAKMRQPDWRRDPRPGRDRADDRADLLHPAELDPLTAVFLGMTTFKPGRAMARLAAGESVRAVALILSVSPASVVRWSQRLRSTGSTAPGRIGGNVPSKISGAHRDWLIERAHAAASTLRGLVAELAEHGLQVDYRTVWKFVHRERLSFKKNPAGQRAGSSGHRAQAKPMAEASRTG